MSEIKADLKTMKGISKRDAKMLADAEVLHRSTLRSGPDRTDQRHSHDSNRQTDDRIRGRRDGADRRVD